MASTIPVIPPNMRKVYRRLKRWRLVSTQKILSPPQKRLCPVTKLALVWECALPSGS